MNLNDLKKELPYKWRVQSTKFGKTTCVAYIDARDCMDILDEVCGPEKWQSIFYEANGLLFCKVGILCDTGREPSQPYTEWVWKSDTGSESKVEKDKGHVSDAFKRACVEWGIAGFYTDYQYKHYKLNNGKVRNILMHQKKIKLYLMAIRLQNILIGKLKTINNESK